MKKIKYSILIFITVLSVSCEDILDREPLDQISDAVVWNDPNLIQAYLYQSYAEVPFHASLGQWAVQERRGILWPFTVVDEGFSKKTQDQGAGIWKKDLLDENGSGLFQYWGYQHVRHANEFLELIKDSDIPEKETYSAEMRFIRAYIYFEMVKRYGGIPLITEAQDINADTDELYVPRSSEKEVYDFIHSELNAITDILPEKYEGGFGRATKYAAAALNSRAMMYAASIAQWGSQQLNGLLGFPPSDAAGYWQKCYDASKIILGNDLKGGVHSLYNENPDKVLNFQNIFLDEKNCEVIFAKQYEGLNVLGHRWDLFNVPYNRVPDDGVGGVYFGNEKQSTSISVYLEMAEEFEYMDGSPGKFFNTRDKDEIAANTYTIEQLFGNKEPRFHASLFYHGALWRETKLDWKKYDVINGEKKNAKNRPKAKYEEVTGFGIRKYVSPTAPLPDQASSDTDYIIFRFGEILLNFAEASYELGKSQEAMDAINELRDRVGLPLYTSIDRDKIRHERKVELAFEGNRFWDLRRWRTLVDKVTRKFYGIEYGQIDGTDNYKIYLIGGSGAGRWDCKMSEKYYYLPITPARIANNPSLAPENPYF